MDHRKQEKDFIYSHNHHKNLYKTLDIFCENMYNVCNCFMNRCHIPAACFKNKEMHRDESGNGGICCRKAPVRKRNFLERSEDVEKAQADAGRPDERIHAPDSNRMRR
ncbi:MAG: hypothetical protein IJN11_07800 [Oscillospiraceae bacterium]|nr:hypothetical protein [Oscillospiraceae bacterium]